MWSVRTAYSRSVLSILLAVTLLMYDRDIVDASLHKKCS